MLTSDEKEILRVALYVTMHGHCVYNYLEAEKCEVGTGLQCGGEMCIGQGRNSRL